MVVISLSYNNKNNFVMKERCALPGGCRPCIYTRRRDPHEVIVYWRLALIIESLLDPRCVSVLSATLIDRQMAHKDAASLVAMRLVGFLFLAIANCPRAKR
jgi:hypothetical protein